MTMSQKDFLQGDPRLPDQCAQPLQVAAGIDDDRPLRLITPEEGAVLLEGRNGQDTKFQHEVYRTTD